MAKKAKSKAKARAKAPDLNQDGGGPKKPVRMVSEQDVNSLVNKCIARKEEVSTASGEIGRIVSDAVEKKGLHRGAFGAITKLVRMGRKDPAKLWLWLAHFDDMREKVKLDALAGSQEEMFGAGTDAKAEDLLDKAGGENVVKIGERGAASTQQ